MFYWGMLMLSISAEIIGTSSMKYAGKDVGVENYIFLFALVGVSYYFLSKAIQGISMSLAYAVWEGIGMVIVMMIGYALFDESLHAYKLLACGAVVSGIILMKRGGVTNKEKGGTESWEQH